METQSAPDLRSWPTQRRVEYFWMIMGKCNYRCPYCVYGLAEFDRRKVDRYYTAQEWMRPWRRMHEKYGEGNIILTGGEPTLYPGFEELVQELSSMFWIAFDTNLSWESKRLAAFLRQVSPKRVRIETSFHPHSTPPEPFIERVLLIREAGFEYIVRLVAYPAILPDLERTRGIFGRHGLTFVVNPFQGIYEGRRYPESYTLDERELIEGSTVNLNGNAQNAPHKEFVRQILNRESPKGRLCRSGYQHIRIEDDGRVFRCGEYSTQNWEPLGGFFDDNLTLWEEPRICRSDRCEWEYRWLVDQAERFQNAQIL